MARLGRSQPFKPLIKPFNIHLQPASTPSGFVSFLQMHGVWITGAVPVGPAGNRLLLIHPPRFNGEL